MIKREINYGEIKAMRDGYIPAPYVLEEGEKSTTFIWNQYISRMKMVQKLA